MSLIVNRGTGLDERARRSALMGRVRQKHTAPELAVRRALHAAGARFRLHRRDLPGSPDIVLAKRRLVIFVHGCFWHRHDRCKKATFPKTRAEFWKAKFDRNVERDAQKTAELVSQGWRVATIWQCETEDATLLANIVSVLLTNDKNGEPVSGDLGRPLTRVR